MIFETLNDSAERGELLLVDGGMCHWHLRRDGQLTIREIISTRKGAGSRMLRRLEATPHAETLLAKCPAGLEANLWYQRRGFHVARAERTKSGRVLLVWEKSLAQTRRRANVGDLEVIYCADGNTRFVEIALDAGMLYGARLPASVGFRPYFADQEWKHPDRARYMTALAEHQPYMATVLDLERWAQRDEVLAWAEEAAQIVQVVVIIPKTHGIIATLPRTINGKQVRLGYSVPTRYGGTTVTIAEFSDWPVHLLGGSPQEQMRLYQRMNVKSVDTNYTQKMALNYGQFWANVSYSAIRFWPRVDEADGQKIKAPAFEAFRRSCRNIVAAWQRVIMEPQKIQAKQHQPLLFDPRELEACELEETN